VVDHRDLTRLGPARDGVGAAVDPRDRDEAGGLGGGGGPVQ
jgi:hypothetical protein